MKKNVLKQNRFINSQRHCCRWPGTKVTKASAAMVWSNLGSDDGWLLTTANSYSRDHTSLTETLSIKKRRILYHYATKFMFYRPIYFDPSKIKRMFQKSTHMSWDSLPQFCHLRVYKIRHRTWHTGNYRQAVTTTTPIIRGCRNDGLLLWKPTVSLLRSQCTRSVPTRL